MTPPEQAPTDKLRWMINNGINALVCGANRERRTKVIDDACSHVNARRRHDYHETSSSTAHELEALGKKGKLYLVVLHDAQRIPPQIMWTIRSVAQFQRHVTYVLEGGPRGKTLDIVARYDAAFYSQLSVVDVGRPPANRRRTP